MGDNANPTKRREQCWRCMRPQTFFRWGRGFRAHPPLLGISHAQSEPSTDLCSLSWSVLGHVLSEEQSKDGSDDGRLTIVQCHLYHRPPLSDLYRTSVGILPYSDTTNKFAFLLLPLPTSTMRYSTTAQPEPHHAPHMFHVSGQPYCTCTSS